MYIYVHIFLYICIYIRIINPNLYICVFLRIAGNPPKAEHIKVRTLFCPRRPPSRLRYKSTQKHVFRSFPRRKSMNFNSHLLCYWSIVAIVGIFVFETFVPSEIRKWHAGRFPFSRELLLIVKSYDYYYHDDYM